MNKIVLFDPSISSLNKGDEIILRSVHEELAALTNGAFVVSLSTHMPVSNIYLRFLVDADLRFVCGSNLLDSKMEARFRQWDVKFRNRKFVGPCILIGTGWREYQKSTSAYTKSLYRNILAKDWVHSVRDSYTEKKVREIGFRNVVNTGCPTMWMLTPEHCSAIPTKKASKVVFTITDFRPDPQKDRMLIDVLRRNYEKLYLWLQGYNDYAYIQSLELDTPLTLLAPTVEAIDEALSDDDIEYVGTRLHAGIRALQKGKRTTIIGVDNRALEKQRDFNLHVLRRSELRELSDILNNEFPTSISVPHVAILEWKSQFSKFIESRL